MLIWIWYWQKTTLRKHRRWFGYVHEIHSHPQARNVVFDLFSKLWPATTCLYLQFRTQTRMYRASFVISAGAKCLWCDPWSRLKWQLGSGGKCGYLVNRTTVYLQFRTRTRMYQRAAMSSMRKWQKFLQLQMFPVASWHDMTTMCTNHHKPCNVNKAWLHFPRSRWCLEDQMHEQRSIAEKSNSALYAKAHLNLPSWQADHTKWLQRRLSALPQFDFWFSLAP